MMLNIAEKLRKILQIKKSQVEMLKKHGIDLASASWNEINSFYDNVLSNSGEQYIDLVDKILGSEEQDNAIRHRAQAISYQLDSIIGKLGTSNAYHEIELDILDQLELKANKILGD